MIIIDPILFSSMTLLASGAPYSDYSAWSSVTAYTVGTRVNYNGRDYECLVANTNVVPSSDTTKWLDLGVVNRLKCFDDIIGTQTVATTTSLSFSVQPNAVFNSIAFFNVEGATIRVRVIDPVEGTVYDKTKSLVNNSNVGNWYDYFFSDIITTGDIVFLDLPTYSTAYINVVITAPSVVKIGEVVIGKQKNLGYTNFGTSVGIIDYSKKEVDQFGNYYVVQRRFAKKVDFDLTIDTPKVSVIQSVLAKLRAKPVVYIGSETATETIIYGFYKNFNVVISGPSASDCTIEVEGLT
jgi:hypothetical protein